MPLLRAHKPRHAKPSKAAPVIAAGGMTAGMTAGLTAAAAPAEAATANDFARLRVCESGDNYRINTGNGYYGAYQFSLRTWRGLGYGGYPHQASPGTQDEAARVLQSQRGWQPWPACARKLGLGRSESTTRATRSRTVVVAKPKAPLPTFTGVMTTAIGSKRYANVQQWQARMAKRGWDIDVDGYFGPQSARVAARFAAEKGLKTKPGTVDRELWRAAWTLPVT